LCLTSQQSRALTDDQRTGATTGVSRLKIKQDKDFQTWVHEHGSWEGIVLGRARQPQNRKYEGMRLAQIAKLRGPDWQEWASNWLALRPGSALRCAADPSCGYSLKQ
jgi:hypothetical protein